MSTRATYQFLSEFGGKTTIYIHHDGYLEGAAHYFFEAARYRETYFDPERAYAGRGARGSLVDWFLRGNDNAEVTASHECHGDTEYRYTVWADGTLKVLARINYGDPDDPKCWREAYSGTCL